MEARIVPTQADPFFISDPAAIAAFIGKRVNESDLSATQLFVLIRDRAFLSVYRFRGVIFFVQLACRENWPLHLWILLLSRAAFNLYSQLPEVFGNRRITLHGLRSGCAISLAMSGADLQTITTGTACHHLRMEQVLRSLEKVV